ncbi:citrate synthase methylcitrate synthase [Micractinium conductrix]|uniref:Citrate synthase methylcitrate synthase n=1 Tax=Micractinium conductrix TaxID=554055 RepID=A0A2P6VIW1_9CHLO|nr:citrate synthase methylcitrate synthase [Micractinium conductrix]|eukprot:PSC74010.1 citrate synthase methylcitrate synthase [Micractinium conductrix]
MAMKERSLSAYFKQGCRRCVCCNDLKQHAGARDGPNAYIGYWPAGLQSPTVYYALKTCQLAFQIRAVAADGPDAWRSHSAAACRQNALLVARARPQLSLRIPHTRCGVEPRDTAVFVRSFVQLPAGEPKPQPQQRAASPRGVAPSDSSFSSTCGSARSVSSSGGSLTASVTPLRLLEQPAKRSRLDAAAPQQRVGPGLPARVVCMSPQGHSAHLIAPAPQRQRRGPVVIPLPTAAGVGASARRAAAAAAAADDGGRPFLGWLQRLRGMLTPDVEAVVAC